MQNAPKLRSCIVRDINRCASSVRRRLFRTFRTARVFDQLPLSNRWDFHPPCAVPYSTYDSIQQVISYNRKSRSPNGSGCA